MLAFFRYVTASALLFALASCASYEPLPLATKPHLATSLQELQKQPPDEIFGKPAKIPRVNPAKPVTANDIALLALEHNPGLRAARDDRSMAEAQLIQAGVLPNPQFSGSYDFFLGGPATNDAIGLGLSEDIRALIVRGAQRDAAEYNARKVDADLLWQEWQTIGKARLLYVDLVEMEKLQDILKPYRQLLADRYTHSHQALLRGNVDLTTEAPDLAALQSADKQASDLDRHMQSKWQEIDALLGLEPDVRFNLESFIPMATIDPAKIERILPELPHIRPDLVALQLGYKSQEEKLRAAVLGQFPALIFGGSYGSDTSRVESAGPSITFDLPLFDRNQGNIAIETASRKKLHDEYTSRLDTATADVKALLAAQVLLQKNYEQTQKALADTVNAAQQADAAFQAGNLDERGYVDLKTTQVDQEQQVIALKQALLEQQVALATLIGTGMPALAPSSTGESP
ncbi:MAG TPA: TolC family protein [Alphaproteobacteria bacterium]|nr:TolC family protein [Alphaproteobacteria bacterium]